MSVDGEFLSRMTDTEALVLLERAKNGEEQAFLELYDRWKGIVFRFACQMAASSSLAEDITQEVFLLVLRGRCHYDPVRGSFTSFIYGVARNVALKHLRKDQKVFGILHWFDNLRLERKVADPLFQLTGNEAAAQLRRCIQSLPAQFREVIVLCDLHELSYAEVATITGSAIGTVRSRLHRGRELLIEKMRNSELNQKNPGGNPHEIPAL